MIKNLSDKIDTNGVMGWCKLVQECSSMTSQRKQSLAAKVYSPKRVKSYAEVNAAIEQWEVELNMFTKMEEHEMNPVTRIYAIRQIVPEEPEKDIVRASFDDYEKVRNYIFEQVAVRRDVPKNTTRGPVEHLIASMWNEKGDENENEEAEEVVEECEPCDDGMPKNFSELFSMMNRFGGKGGKIVKETMAVKVEVPVFKDTVTTVASGDTD